MRTIKQSLSKFSLSGLGMLFGLLLFAGCSNDDGDGTFLQEDYPMTFGTVYNIKSSTGNTWDGGEQVAVMINSEVKNYTTASSGTLTVTSGTPFYWQSQNETKIVQAWYPYSASAPTSWTVQAAQSGTGYQQSDLLYAPATDISFTNRNSTSLPFYHQTAKVVVNIVNGEAAISAIDISEVKIGYNNNLALSADYTPPSGSVNQDTWSSLTDMGVVSPKDITSGTTYLKSYAALVIPQDMAGKKFISVALSNGNTYYYTPTGTVADLQGGKQYTYNITVKNSGITVSTSDITDWGGTSNVQISGGAGIYKVGDYYPDPKVVYSSPGIVQSGTAATGIVFWVDPADSRHGKIVSLDMSSDKVWSDLDALLNTSMTNGMENMKLIADYISRDNKSWNNFPAPSWAHDKNGGGATNYYSNTTSIGIWYLPARDELEYLACAYNNKPFEIWTERYYYPSWGPSNDLNANMTFDTKLIEAGGIGLRNHQCWSSSEGDLDIYYLRFNDSFMAADIKQMRKSSRAVAKF